MGTSSAWTPERRQRQREAIKRWKPWEKSTGPRTEAGKLRSSRNAAKSPEIIELEAMMEQGSILHDLLSYLVLLEGERPLSGVKVSVDRKKRERLFQSLSARGAFDPNFLAQFQK